MKINYEDYWKDRIKRNYVPLMPRHREIVRIITKTKDSGKVLDLGCGEGQILKMLPNSYEKYGVDISENALKLVNDRNIYVKSCNLNRDFPFHMNFDFIICSEVLEHLEQPSNVLENVKKYLTKDGLFLVTTPNITLWTHRIRLLIGKFPNYDKSHINFWDLDSFIKLLHNYGYEILNFYPTLFNPFFFSKLSLRYIQIYKLFGEQFLFICKNAK
jgi:methionine biosynthesis protein MetW